MSEDTTSQALPASADGTLEAVSAPSAQATEQTSPSVKDVLGQVLGKSFKDDATALKSIKDTFDFVGKAGSYQSNIKKLTAKFATDELGVISLMENLANQSTETQVTQPTESVMGEIQALKQQVEESEFFAERPDLKEHKDLLRELRGSTGKRLSEVAELPSVKSLLEKARAADEMERSKSVLQSNPRLGQVRDKLAEAREAAKSGNDAVAKSAAVSAVLDAFEK